MKIKYFITSIAFISLIAIFSVSCSQVELGEAPPDNKGGDPDIVGAGGGPRSLIDSCYIQAKDSILSHTY